jgi:hypothetical protein
MDISLGSRVVAVTCFLAAASIGCGGEAGATDGGTCSQLSGATALLSSPLPTENVYFDLSSDGQDVYFTSNTTIYRVAVSGGTLATLYSGGLAGFGGAYGARGGTIAWAFPKPGTQDAAGITIRNASGSHDVALPSGAIVANPMLVDVDGNVFYEMGQGPGAVKKTYQVWRWNPATRSATKMPGVGPGGGGPANVYLVDRGQILWASTGIYLTDVSTGKAHQLDVQHSGFGSPIGVDATNVYGWESNCADSACPFTIWGTPRGGGKPFIAYKSDAAYRTNGLQADDSGFYWIDWKTHGIYHATLNQSAPATLLVQLPAAGITPNLLALDACNVYWLDANGTGATQQVMAASK